MSWHTPPAVLIALILCPLVFAQESEPHATDYSQAIAYGKRFKSRAKFLDDGIKPNKIQLASSMAIDGISKYVTLFTDFEAVAAAAAAANQEMRDFTEADAAKLPLSRLVYANVAVHGRGAIPVAKVEKRFIHNAPHLVLQIDGVIVQPLTKEAKAPERRETDLGVTSVSVTQLGSVSLLTANRLGWIENRVELEFAFRLSPEQLKKHATVILIDGEGNRTQKEVDLSKILRNLGGNPATAKHE
jgi:hypothetical protein